MKTIPTMLTAVASAVLLAACNSSSSDDDNSARFSFAVSDAPVEQANVVMVCFESVELVGNDGGPRTFSVGDGTAVEANDNCLDASGNVIPNTHGIDLLTLQGANAEALVSQAEVEAGTYGQMRLKLADEGSYVEDINGDRGTIKVPSDHIRLDGVTLTAGGNFSYTLEFDLRKALLAPPGLGEYLLKPRGLRLVDNSEVGHIEGTVAETLLLDNNCDVPPEDASAPVAAIYFYEGHDFELDALADNSNEEDGPYASVAVYFDGAMSYDFELGYMESGDYFAAVTCDTDDDPEEETDLDFFYGENIAIESGQTLTLNLGE